MDGTQAGRIAPCSVCPTNEGSVTMPIMGIDQLNILIVDDNAHMRTLLAGILRAIGVSAVFDAGAVDTAYTELSLRPIDLVFVD